MRENRSEKIDGGECGGEDDGGAVDGGGVSL